MLLKLSLIFTFDFKRNLLYVILADMDATECEKKRVEYIDDLTDLEKQFAILREQ